MKKQIIAAGIVVAIIGLAAIAVVLYINQATDTSQPDSVQDVSSDSSNQSTINEEVAAADKVDTALKAWYEQYSAYPSDISELNSDMPEYGNNAKIDQTVLLKLPNFTYTVRADKQAYQFMYDSLGSEQKIRFGESEQVSNQEPNDDM
jgi:cytoskeletal protein RodZ